MKKNFALTFQRDQPQAPALLGTDASLVPSSPLPSILIQWSLVYLQSIHVMNYTAFGRHLT